MDLMDYSYTKQNSRLREREQHEESFQFLLESLKTPDNLETPKASLSNSDALNRKKTEQRSTQWPIIHKNKPSREKDLIKKKTGN